MPSTYKLKNDPLDKTRLQKIAKNIVDEAKEDRAVALDAYKYFKEMVEENPQDNAAKTLMVECLKLAQGSKTNVIKAMEVVVKLETVQAKNAEKGTTESLYSQLDSLS
jgi:hypothetical protein